MPEGILAPEVHLPPPRPRATSSATAGPGASVSPGALTGPATSTGLAASADTIGPPPPASTTSDARGVAPATSAAISQPRPAPSSVERSWRALPVPSARANVRAVHDNNESWLCVWNILGSARKKIDASYFVLSRDIFGIAFLGMLLRKRQEGLPVNLLLDATGGTLGIFGLTQPLHGEDYLQELANTGANVSIYNPYYKKLPRQLMHPTSALGISANHDKILATERYAMTGGRNIAAEYFSSPDDQPTRFRDSDVVVEGAKAVQQLDRAIHAEFDRDDLNQRLRPDLLGNWMHRDVELLGTAAMMDAWLNRAPLSDTQKQELRTNPEARDSYADELVNAALADLGWRNVSVDWSGQDKLRARALELAANPNLAGANRGFQLNRGMIRADVKALDRTSVGSMPGGHDEVDPGFERLIMGARKSILLTNPYVILNERERYHLEQAGRRGVKIILLTDSPTTTDEPLPQGFFLREWPKILARTPNMRIFVLNGDQRLHAKTAVADGEVSLIGSFNLDPISSSVNGEILETVHSRALARRMEEQFMRDLKDPRNRVREYTIARTPEGKPLLRDGQPIVTYGPENYISPKEMRSYAFWMPFTQLLEELPQLTPLHEYQ